MNQNRSTAGASVPNVRTPTAGVLGIGVASDEALAVRPLDRRHRAAAVRHRVGCARHGATSWCMLGSSRPGDVREGTVAGRPRSTEKMAEGWPVPVLF
jgi:hypothetical protein